jgi:hypothetical protein
MATTQSVHEDTSAAEPAPVERMMIIPFKIEAWRMASASTATSFMLSSMVANMLVIVAFAKFKYLRDPTNFLICNQSVADLTSAFLGLAFNFFNYTSVGRSLISIKSICCLYLGVTTATFLVAFVNIFALSMERLMCIASPFASPRKKAVIQAWIAMTWVVILTTNGLPLMGFNIWKANSRLCSLYFIYPDKLVKAQLIPMFLAIGLTLIVNIAIVMLLLKRYLKKKEIIVPVSANAAAGSNEKLEAMRAYNKRVTMMLLLVVCVFFVTWLPFLTMTSYSAIRPMDFGRNEYLRIIHAYSKWPMLIAGILNPVIYARKNPRFMKAFKELLGRK